MRVEQVLRGKGEDVVTVAAGASVAEAVRVLSQNGIGAVVVAEGGRPVGILSERDVVRELGRSGPDCLGAEVSRAMTRDPVTCRPSDSLDQVLGTMTDGRFRHMPVMEGGAMVGLVSIGDVVKARLSELAHERDALTDLVAGR